MSRDGRDPMASTAWRLALGIVPVLAGFMNGVAALIVLSQLPPLLGVPADELARNGLATLTQLLRLRPSCRCRLHQSLWRRLRLPRPRSQTLPGTRSSRK